MVAGWKASTYNPLTPRQAEQARQFDEVRGPAGEDPDLARRLDEMATRVQPRPPYQGLGRLAVFAGLALFIAAGVLMYRQPPPPEEPAAQTDEAASLRGDPAP
jgi:hypothetical protein